VEIDPQVDPEQPVPVTVQCTDVLVLPVTVAENCSFSPQATWAVDGETETDTDSMATVAEADCEGAAAEVALTVTCAGFGVTLGAVYNPEVEIDPQADPEQPVPATVHCTDVLVLPVTVAENCCFPPRLSRTVDGETETDTDVSGSMTIVAEADFVGAASEVAVTTTFAGLGMTAGAV
jgi:hypothetical protein